MKDAQPDELDRRAMLKGGVAALVALMLDASAAARAADKVAPHHKAASQDPRHAFADRISDIVIPATDTPGASAAHVADFVLLAVDHRMSDLNPEMLQQVNAALDEAAKGSFMRLPRAHQTELLTKLDADAFASREAAAGSLAYSWRRIKTAIIAGYYTSEIGASKELIFEPVPGGFSNIKLTPAYRNRSNEGFGGAL